MNATKWLLMLLLLAGCTNSLEKEFNRLKAEVPKTATEAEAAFHEVEGFGKALLKEEDPPKALLEKVRSLQTERAKEFAKAAAREGKFGSIGEVWSALRSCHLDVSSVTTPGDSTVAKFLKLVDPTSDSIPKGWR